MFSLPLRDKLDTPGNEGQLHLVTLSHIKTDHHRLTGNGHSFDCNGLRPLVRLAPLSHCRQLKVHGRIVPLLFRVHLVAAGNAKSHDPAYLSQPSTKRQLGKKAEHGHLVHVEVVGSVRYDGAIFLHDFDVSETEGLFQLVLP